VSFVHFIDSGSLIHAHDTCFWPIRWKNGRQAWRREKSVGREDARLMSVQIARFAICVSPPVLISLSRPACTRELPWLELRATLMLINYIDTCSYPLACNNPTAWPRLYCIIRKCSRTQELEDDSLLTVNFSDTCRVQTEKEGCGAPIRTPEMTSCKARKFPWAIDWAVRSLTIMSSTQISAQFPSRMEEPACPNLDFWVYPLLWP
jgi:hypothetical protein